MRYCEVSKLARGVHSQDVYRVPDGRKYCASMGSRCFPCLFPISWQKTRPKSVRVQRRIGCVLASVRCPAPAQIGPLQGPIVPQLGYSVSCGPLTLTRNTPYVMVIMLAGGSRPPMATAPVARRRRARAAASRARPWRCAHSGWR